VGGGRRRFPAGAEKENQNPERMSNARSMSVSIGMKRVDSAVSFGV